MAIDEEQVLLTAREAARYLHISLFTLNKIEKQGRIVPFRTPGGHRRYNLAMLNEYLQASRTSAISRRNQTL
jgi:excisionase family DNA binding protein